MNHVINVICCCQHSPDRNTVDSVISLPLTNVRLFSQGIILTTPAETKEKNGYVASTDRGRHYRSLESVASLTAARYNDLFCAIVVAFSSEPKTFFTVCFYLILGPSLLRFSER